MVVRIRGPSSVLAIVLADLLSVYCVPSPGLSPFRVQPHAALPELCQIGGGSSHDPDKETELSESSETRRMLPTLQAGELGWALRQTSQRPCCSSEPRGLAAFPGLLLQVLENNARAHCLKIFFILK